MEVKRYIPLIRLYAVREKELEYETTDLECPEKVEKIARSVIGNADREMLVVLSVNNRNKPVALEIISIGTISEAIAQAREIFKHAILNNAAGIFLIHNHTSGVCQPSREDKIFTEKIRNAGDLLGISLQDHLIIGDGYFSFMEHHLL